MDFPKYDEEPLCPFFADLVQ